MPVSRAASSLRSLPPEGAARLGAAWRWAGQRCARAAWAGWVFAAGAAAAQPAAVVEACTACHGPGGNSVVAAVPSIAGQPQRFLENQMVLIREGLRDVPAMKAVMGGLGDEEIVAVARRFAALPAALATGPMQADKRKRGAEISARALCGTCHLPGYVGQGQVPRLAGQPEAYLLPTLKMYRDNPAPGRDTAMSAVLLGLSDADLDNLAHHLTHTGR